jgi:cell shape-determining protein MreC
MMSDRQTVQPNGLDTTTSPDREPLFQRVADKVSYGMGTPQNIAVWIVLVVGWTLLFALSKNPHIEHGTFLPAWFTSTGYNFPLNLVTTVAELYIGFLVGASSNRSERNLEMTLAKISAQDEQIDAVEIRLGEALKQNTDLTAEIHALTKVIHQTICAGRG